MSYQVLARKWRPKTFATMVGQSHVLRAIQNALTQQRLHHAYLFTGTRGVGKTTIARLFAKALNCEQGISAEPCGQCQSCQDIDLGRSVDLIEVDAASRTKVEDTRELLDNVQYAPTRSRFKIYLIDEVHMLSGHSFNALLKTLEEPPAHVKFLLATTDPQKLPITVLSRCLQFHLKNLPANQISSYLAQVLTAENISFEEEALTLIAKAAKGSMRDALSTLDQAIAFCQNQVNVTDVSNMLGLLPEERIMNLLDAIINHRPEQLMQHVASLAETTVDYAQVLDELINILHQIAVAQFVLADQSNPSILAFAKQCTPEDIQLYYQIALLGRRDLPLLVNPRQGLEMTLLRMLAFEPITATDTVKSAATTTAPTPAQQKTNPATHNQQATITSSATPANTAPPTVDANDWGSLVKALNLSGISLLLANHCHLVSREDNQFNLQIAPIHSAMLNDRAKERLQTALENYLQKKIRLNFILTEPEQLTPADTEQKNADEKQAQLVDNMLNDPNIQAIKQIFQVDIDPNMIKSV